MHVVIQISAVVVSCSSPKGEDMNGKVHSKYGCDEKKKDRAKEFSVPLGAIDFHPLKVSSKGDGVERRVASVLP